MEMIDDRVVSPAGVGAYLPPERHIARHLYTAAALTCSQSRAKRCLDVFGAITGLVILAPVLVLLAMLVALDSPGPILFTQTRVGFRGRTFRMLKFRTMRDGADGEKAAVAGLNQADDTRLFKIPADPRVTRLGRVLRRWSLDELPQLFNILNGEMSLVGPRPFFESDLDDYDAHHFRRLSVPPGLTGLWQVSGRSDIVEFEEVVRLDRYYIEHWSMSLDLRILARTLPTVISRRGAY
jgi:lipopolysaccharide/colanic/teichoic acid biosynthesis glycosyltransferase